MNPVSYPALTKSRNTRNYSHWVVRTDFLNSFSYSLAECFVWLSDSSIFELCLLHVRARTHPRTHAVAWQPEFESKDCPLQMKSSLSFIVVTVDRKEVVMGRFLGIGVFNFMLSGCIKTGDTELVLIVLCRPKPSFHHKVRNLHLAPMTAWRCRPWSASTWSGSVLHVQI